MVMMTQLRFALKNLLGAGTRTWLNVAVTSFTFVIIIFMSGLYQGILAYSKRVTVESEVAGGIYWHPLYDPDDPFTLDDSHGTPPQAVLDQVAEGRAMSVLLVTGAAYINGRMIPMQLRGIDPAQQIVAMPTASLADYDGDAIPVMIGAGMAKLLGAGEGDAITIRWRDANGTYDAADVEISKVMSVENFKVDFGILWLPLAVLQEMSNMPGEATYVTVRQGEPLLETASPWVLKTVMSLMEDMIALVQAKQSSAAIIYVLLLALSALGIFNSQVLSIFQRRREIGTLMALGMSRQRVVGLFTLEGGIHSVLALILAFIYGAPLLYLTASRGLPLPMDYSDSGFLIGERLFPVYGPWLVAGTTLLVATIVTVVSYLPSRKIAKMEPTAALRGKIA